MNKNQQKKYEQAVTKGRQFFNKKNYQLAKRHFETMLRLNPDLKNDQEFSAKLALCKEQEVLRLGKEAIKKGRNYENKNKLSLALECFEKAFAVEQSEWLQKKIEQLKERTADAQVEQLLTEVQKNDSPEDQLEHCKKALQLDANNIAVQKQMAQCYVKLHDYTTAITLFSSIVEQNQNIAEQKEPLNSSDAYYFGYAYLHTDHLLLALLQWTKISVTHPQAITVYQQFKALLPFAMRELKQNPPDDQIIEAFYHFILLFEKKEDVACQEENDLKSLYIEQLWKKGQYLKIHELITPLSNDISLSQLELYSKLYFKLANETEELEYLEYAINFWLSAIYNEKLLYSLAAVQNTGGAGKTGETGKSGETIDVSNLQEQLLLKLATLIKTIDNKKSLPEETKTLWKTQRDNVLLLYRLQNKSKTFKKNLKIEFYPCTPVFAKMFNLNHDIYELVLANRRYLMGKHNKFTEDQYYECCCYFSPLANYMLSIITHKEAEALKALSRMSRSKVDNKDLFDYCQQKIAFEYGFRSLSQKKKKSAKGDETIRVEKLFLQALPLIKKYSEYADKLADFALTHFPSLDMFVPVANIMETLSKHIKEKKFIHATVYAMTMKATQMNNSGVSNKVVEKQLAKALALEPDNYIALEAMRNNQEDIYFEKFSQALERSNITQASTIVIESGLDSLKTEFFRVMEIWQRTLFFDDRSEDEELMIINEMYINCRRIDKYHPVTIKLGEMLEQ